MRPNTKLVEFPIYSDDGRPMLPARLDPTGGWRPLMRNGRPVGYYQRPGRVSARGRFTKLVTQLARSLLAKCCD